MDTLRTCDKGVCKSPCSLVFKGPEPVIKVFANGGGPPTPPPHPPQPPTFFLRHAGCLSRKSHDQQELRQTRSCYGVFFQSSYRRLFANEGLRSRQHPRVIFKLCKIAAAIIPATKTKPIWTPSEPVIKVFANGGGLRPRPTPRFFNTMQANFKYLRTSKDRTHMDPLRTRDKGVCKWGGGCALRPPTPPLFFDATQAGFQKPRTRDIGVCKWGLRPPQPPRFF